jgi:uncharacterized membrane protein (UPF0127 family)
VPESGPSRLTALPSRGLPGGLLVLRADTHRARLRGLAGVPELPDAWALHLPRCRSVHTFGMRFALDLIWLDRAGVVVRVDERVPPRRVRGCRGARDVVEVVAGCSGTFLAAGLGAGAGDSAAA